MGVTPGEADVHFPTAKSLGVLKQRMGITVPPHTGIGVGPPCRPSTPRPGIEPGLQEPESDADPFVSNPFGASCRPAQRGAATIGHTMSYDGSSASGPKRFGEMLCLHCGAGYVCFLTVNGG